MSEWDCPLEQKWTEPVKEQAIFYLSKAYMQGYNDALAEIEKETRANVQLQPDKSLPNT